MSCERSLRPRLNAHGSELRRRPAPRGASVETEGAFHGRSDEEDDRDTLERTRAGQCRAIPDSQADHQTTWQGLEFITTTGTAEDAAIGGTRRDIVVERT
jgi:hypothetical protein